MAAMISSMVPSFARISTRCMMMDAMFGMVHGRTTSDVRYRTISRNCPGIYGFDRWPR
jgi:hypothetical protein